ncbi:LCP family protein [Nocardioides sp. CER19]|uniref:LCP family protein n=1 Tax=Nocardioides sp. CER19 TaxID=3038538 RepID=UPI00244BE45C|nr:LCP family protein [Nocardioides sp. CER19]MDH2414663.1 LCP family protein [Nocardioides sp. CER19]
MTDVEQSSAHVGGSSRDDIEDTAIRPVDPRIARRGSSRGPRGGRRRATTRKRHTVFKVVLTTVVVLAMITGLGVAYLYRDLNGNLTIANYKDQFVEKAPKKVEFAGPTDPINILIMGEDSRDCSGCGVDKEKTAGLSDTTILLHLSRDRKHAYGISIPRDSLVERPECKKEDGSIVPGSSRTMWNAAFAYGGPACTISQFQHDTGIPVDYSVVVNFGGFKGMVDAVGGVDVCVPETFYDSYTKTTFEGGTHKLDGTKALAYVRVRHGIGDGSDIGRTRRQQAFIASMVNQVMSANTLANPIKVVKFLRAATKSLELSEVGSTGLGNIKELAGLALQFKNIGLDKIEFLTVPFVYGSGDERGRVLWTSDATKVWDRIKNDRPLGDVLTANSIKVNHVPGQAASTNPASPSSSSSPSSSPSGGASSSPTAGASAGGSPSSSSTGKSDGLTETQKSDLKQVGLCT